MILNINQKRLRKGWKKLLLVQKMGIFHANLRQSLLLVFIVFLCQLLILEETLELNIRAKEARARYEESVINANETITKSYETCQSISEVTERLEADRTSITKIMLGKYSKLIKSFAKTFANEGEKVQKTSERINPAENAKTLLSETKTDSLNNLFEPVKFVTYSAESMNELMVQEENKNVIDNIFEMLCKKLFTGIPLAADERHNMHANLQNIKARRAFVGYLSQVAEPTLIESEIMFENISELCVELLNVGSDDENLVNTVMKAGRYIYIQKEELRQMYNFLGKHKVWQSLSLWEMVIDGMIDKNLAELAEWRKHNKKIIKRDLDEEKRRISVAVVEVLSQYMFYLSHFGLDRQNAISLVLKYSKQYEVEKAKVCELLLELMISQPLPRDNKKNVDIVLTNHKKILTKYKYSNTGLIIGKSIPYIDRLMTLRNILLLNKPTNELLKRDIFYHVHFNLNLTISTSHRAQIWGQILQPIPARYEEIKKQFCNTKNKKAVSELIRLDIKRSFQNSKTIDPSTLANVLEHWVLNEKEIGYYQGMSFLVGVLLLITRSEKSAFAYFERLIKHFGMDELFVPDTPLLLVRFYQLNRLVYLYYPELSNWLHTESFMASCYASAWFITIFANSLHFMQGEELPKVLSVVWDAFMVDGWKAVFKAALFFIAKIRGKVLGKRMDEVIKAFAEIQQNEFMNSETIAQEFKANYKLIKVTNSTLKVLHKEYNKAMETSNNISSPQLHKQYSIFFMYCDLHELKIRLLTTAFV
eukprot:TRINITY_DN949_c0_g1_i1.p1 TRINITY_DN949_c0_g1~~TRINITY_DN949_c0_g1_i1.p1  ORF type:complete len:762 (+),score=81.02 TRINITY_DN949_c0_g1_i1:8464-10749(+)